MRPKISRLAGWVAATLLFSTQPLQAAQWHTVSARGSAEASGEVRASQYRVVMPADDYLSGLYEGNLRLELPLPEGGFVHFTLEPYDVMPPDLAARYPSIRTFRAQGTVDTSQSGRVDIGPNGFHAVFTHQGRLIYVDPLSGGRYAVYDQRDAQSRLSEEADRVLGLPKARVARQVVSQGNELRTYTIAMSAAGEYTRYFGGSKLLAMTAIATLINRVNEVYRRDLGIEFQLVSGNDNLIYTDPTSDPFNNSDQDLETNIVVQRNARSSSQIGTYDIGHVVNTGGGGLASLGVLCTGDDSAGGMTGSDTPVGDAFFIDYVAHEIGHQLGAEHTFNGTTGSCGGGNRAATQAWEPGSGSTIMAYAGICSNGSIDENLQTNSDPYFHSKSIEQMKAHIATVPGCGTAVASGNRPPVVDGGADYTIPAHTPFVLKGSGSDPDGDDLVYTWEQVDLGAASSSADTMVDDGTRPLFRFLPPTKLPERTLPAFDSLLSGTLAKGEAWPTTDRTLHFRLTARDGKGGVTSDEKAVNVRVTSSPFAVTSSGTLSRGVANTVTWQVGETDLPPINCAKVDISLTADEGTSWSALASGVPNSGSASVTLPAGSYTQARVKVACSDNIFFALSSRLPAVDGAGSSGGGSSGGGGGGSLGILGLLLAGGALWRRRGS
ncbi:reprolysin-like metallopeptidase [Aeromonas sp. R6-2]|uniref:reprolysin-like metallopeptidase n=2 Tax=unclassified Aeromonas TaxID=257493 RepID=UPI0034A44E85